jgi:hypothetical protein
MTYNQPILKIIRNRKFLKIIKKLQLGRIIVTFCALISVFIPECFNRGILFIILLKIKKNA